MVALVIVSCCKVYAEEAPCRIIISYIHIICAISVDLVMQFISCNTPSELQTALVSFPASKLPRCYLYACSLGHLTCNQAMYVPVLAYCVTQAVTVSLCRLLLCRAEQDSLEKEGHVDFRYVSSSNECFDLLQWAVADMFAKTNQQRYYQMARNPKGPIFSEGNKFWSRAERMKPLLS